MRIAPLAVLPVFFKLDGKRAVLAGGIEPALWKAELLAAAGANVEIFAETFAEGFAGLEASPLGGRFTLNRRRWQPADLDGAAIAVGALTNDAEAADFAAAARTAGVPVNVIDRPAFCDFQFGAIVNRSPLVVAISTDGAAPVFGQAIRSLIEGLLPAGFGQWVEAARAWRRQGDRLGATPNERRRFWGRFTDLALRQAERLPTESDLDQLLADVRAGTSQSGPSQPVAIIDVASGGAEALTLGTVRVLRSADIIFFDQDVPAAVLEFARREALRQPILGDYAQASASIVIAEEIVAAVRDGKRIVRLRTADMLNGIDAAGEPDPLADALRAAGLHVAVIPAGRSA